MSKTKEEILHLLRSLRHAPRRPSSLRSSEIPGHLPGDRGSKTLRNLDELRSRREQLQLLLLEERMVGAIQMLEERIEAIERSMVAGEGEREETRARHGRRALRESRANDVEREDRDARPARSARARSSQRDDRQYLLSGMIQDGVLSDILQLVSNNERTGIFSIDSDGRAIDLFFREGHLQHASCDDLTGESAFFAAMAVQEGRFSFEETDDIPEEKTITGDTHFLILDALVKIDEESSDEEEAERPSDDEEASAGAGEEEAEDTRRLDALLGAAGVEHRKADEADAPGENSGDSDNGADSEPDQNQAGNQALDALVQAAQQQGAEDAHEAEPEDSHEAEPEDSHEADAKDAHEADAEDADEAAGWDVAE